ncbi:MAG: GGDEF domain-containing protein, partial [Christensenella sp.]|uniref:GGDEF domain-containing protein n=1 Tax=Christensenella sp. TaxID=1935934 RepID=UPI002B2036E9
QFMGQKKCWEALFPGQIGPCDFCPQEKLIDEQGAPTKVYSWDYQRPFDGSWFRVFSAAFVWVDGRLAHVVSSADITENKRNEAMIEKLANYDQLTGLPNRRMLIRECEGRIDKATATEQGYLLFFDIDGFKAINDNFGHDEGDEFLIQLGKFFSSIPMIGDSIYRNGGDEFVAVLGGEAITKANIRSLVGFIHERFKKPWKLKTGEIYCSASIGVSCYPEDGTTAEELLKKADMAMYQVKKAGGKGMCFGYEIKDTIK